MSFSFHFFSHLAGQTENLLFTTGSPPSWIWNCGILEWIALRKKRSKKKSGMEENEGRKREEWNGSSRPSRKERKEVEKLKIMDKSLERSRCRGQNFYILACTVNIWQQPKGVLNQGLSRFSHKNDTHRNMQDLHLTHILAWEGLVRNETLEMRMIEKKKGESLVTNLMDSDIVVS